MRPDKNSEPQSALTESIDVADRIARFGQVTQLTDRILNPRVKELRIVNVAGPPAWTDGRVIWLNRDQLPPFGREASKASLITWMGANYHELGHTLHSPRESSKLMKMVRKAADFDPDYQNLHMTENLIEDQRQERLMTMRYRYITPYLTDACIRLVIEGATEGRPSAAMQRHVKIGEAWPWLVGRTWLPEDIRRASRENFDGPGTKLARLVGRYQRLVDPANADAVEAFDVLCEIHDLLQALPQFADKPPPMGCGNKHGTAQQMKNGGQPVPAPYAGDESETAPSAGSKGDTALKKKEDNEKDDAEGAGGQGEGGGENESNGDGDGGGGISDEGGDGAGGAGASGGHDEKMADNLKDLADALTNMVKDAMKADDSFSEHLKSVADAVNLDRSDGASKLGKGGLSKLAPASGSLRGVAHRMGRTFRQFVDAAMPYWEFETSTGRLNVPRYLNRSDFQFDGMFDRFEEGLMDDVSLDVTILIDVSSSMGAQIMPGNVTIYNWRTDFEAKHGRWPTMQEARDAGGRSLVDLASEAAWVIRKAVERAEGTTTVIAYNTKAFLIAQTGEKPHPSKVQYLADQGGTDPSDAIKDAYQRSKGVDAAHRIVVALTDGAWYRGGEVMRDISRRGVTTVGVHVGHHNSSHNKETRRAQDLQMQRRMGVDHYASIQNPMEMVALFEKVVAHQLEEVLIKARA